MAAVEKRVYRHACADDKYTPSNTATIYQIGTIHADRGWVDYSEHPYTLTLAQGIGAAIAQAAVQCYNNAAGGQHLIIIGINNAPFDVANYNLQSSARDMASVINAAVAEQKALSSDGSTVAIAAGLDGEMFGTTTDSGGHLRTVKAAITWESELLNDQAQAIYDYGDTAGCGTNSGNSTVCTDAAQLQGMLDNRAVFAFPQEYDTNGAQAQEEGHIVDIGTKGHHVQVVGALTTYNSCHPFHASDDPIPTCDPSTPGSIPTDNTPDAGFSQLIAAIKHEQPQGIAYLSDITPELDLTPIDRPPAPRALP